MTTFRTLPVVLASFALVLTACQQPADSADADDEAEAMDLTFNELMTLNQDYECTFDHIDDIGARTAGTVYVQSGEKNMRGMFEVTADGQTYDANVIHTNNMSYVWTSQQEQGFMIATDDHTLFGSEVGDDAPIDEGEKVSFNCKPWRADASTFDVPSDREFVDMQAQMDAMMEGMQLHMNGSADGSVDVKAMQCAACEQIPDATGKAQCQAALGCS